MSGRHKGNAAIPISLILLAAVGLAAAPAVARTPSPQTEYSGPGRYEIENVASGKVLDLNRQDQRTIVQWPRNHSQSQQWDIEDAGNGYVYIKSALTRLAIDIDGGRARDGARVITSQPSGADSQLWKMEGKGGERRFTSRLNISLDLPHGSRDDGVEYQVWSAASQDNQRFRLVWIGASVPVNANNYGGERAMTEEKRSYDRGYHSGAEDFRARRPPQRPVQSAMGRGLHRRILRRVRFGAARYQCHARRGEGFLRYRLSIGTKRLPRRQRAKLYALCRSF